MEPTDIFYKELPVDKNNIFNANIAEKNEVEEVKFKKSKEYAVTGLSVNKDTDSSLVMKRDTDRPRYNKYLDTRLVKEKKKILPLTLESTMRKRLKK